MRIPARHRPAVRCWIASIPLAVLLAAYPEKASAGDVVWNVASPADWNTASNWSPTRVPTGSDNATFNNGGTANYSTNVTDTFTDIRFGDGEASGGTLNQSSGTINAAGGWLRMNISGTANSSYTLSGFASAIFARANIGETTGSGASTLNLQGDSAQFTIPQSSAGNGQGALFIGGGTGSGNGVVTITGGTMNIGADTLDNESIVVGNGGTNTAQLNIAGSGFVSIKVMGAGNFYVGNTSPGVVNQSNGSINLFTALGANSWLRIGSGANGTYTLSGGGNLTTTNATNDLVLGNTGVTGTFNLNGGTATIGGAIYSFGPSFFNFNGGTLRPNANQTAMDQTSFMSGLSAATVQAGGAIIDTNGFNITISQNLIHDATILGNDGGLAKNGAGTLTLSGTNTFNGNVTINGGTLRLGNSAAFNPSTPPNVTLTGPSETLTLSGFSATIYGLASTFAGSGVVVQNASPTPATLTLNLGFSGQGSAFSYYGVLQDGPGGGALALVKNGAGSETLLGNNTISGGVTINEGNILLGSPTSLGASTGPLTFGSGGASGFGGLSLFGNSITIGDLNSTTFAPNMKITNATNTAATLTITGSGTDTFADVLEDHEPGFTTAPLSVVKAGSSSLTLSATNTFSGGVALNAGTLVIGNASALGSGALTAGGGTLAADANGPYTVSNAVNLNNVLTVAGNYDFTLSGQISGRGSLVKSGLGTLTLAGNNSFTGGVAINGGTLQLGNTAALNSGSPNAVSFGPSSTGTLNLNGNSVIVSGLTTSTPAGTPVVQDKAILTAAPATLIVDNSGANTFAGVLQDGVGGGALSLVKTGLGTLTISGTNYYSGNTSINAGTLRFAVTGSPTIGVGAIATVSSGATLELAGSVSALSSGSIRVNIINNSAAPGVLVSGTNQQVGDIDGSGTTQVNTGSDLTANHIVQSALVIGGTAASPGFVTIAGSDASGNRLVQSSGFALAGSLVRSGALGEGVINPATLSSISADSTDLAVPAAANSVGIGNASQVPEPSTLLLAFLAVFGVISAQFVRHHFRCQIV